MGVSKKLKTRSNLSRYLQSSAIIDFEHPCIQEYIAEYNPAQYSDIEIVKDMFHFVRDKIAHSFDIKGRQVTSKASEVLLYRESICYGKSHLFAALLRGMGIPAGFCYQRLTIGDTLDSGIAIHALNTVFLESIKQWIRLDARGNKPGVDAQFSVAEEKLAFSIREHYGEVDYLVNLPEPHPDIVHTLEANKDNDPLDMYWHHLPTDLTFESFRKG